MKVSLPARIGFVAAVSAVSALAVALLLPERGLSSERRTAKAAGPLQERAVEIPPPARTPSEPGAIGALARGSWKRGADAVPLRPAAGGFETARPAALDAVATSWGVASDAVSQVGSCHGAGFSVSWRGKRLDVRPVFGRDGAAWSGDGLVVYPDISEGVHSVLMALPEGLEEFLVLNNASRAPKLEYTVPLPGWVTRVRETDQGTVEFWDGEAAWMRADAPEAKDAQGKTYCGRARVTETSGREEAVAGGRQWAVKGGDLRIAFEMDLSGAMGPIVVDPGWSATGAMTTARYFFTTTLLASGKLLAAGGYNSGSGFLTSSELYDPANGTWSATGSMATPRYAHVATLLPNGQLLVAGGQNGGGGSGVLSSCELYDPVIGTWSGTASMVSPRYQHTATLLPSGKVLVVGGDDDNIAGGGPSFGELYDPVSGTWSVTGSMSTTRSGGHSLTLLPGGKVLVAGGYNGGYLAACELYDAASGTWSSTGAMTSVRVGHTATLLPSGKVLAVGGYGGSGYLPSSELYDPATGTWSGSGSMSTARIYHTVTLLPNGKVLATGGSFNSGSGILSSSELYDPASGTWSVTGSMATARWIHTATLLSSGKVLVAGGLASGGGYLTSSELYDPASGTWSSTGSMATARYVHTATLLPNGKVLVAGGAGSGLLSSSELYDPASGTWSSTGPMATAREFYTATLLPSGQVLVAGGAGSSGYLTSCELYDPASGTWSSTGSMATARNVHTATLLPSGKVLVAGGGGSSGDLTSCELYDPASGTWSSTGSMATARDTYTATLLPSGQVLVAGGYNGAYLTSSELYDPTSGTWSATGSMATARAYYESTLLPSGQVLVAGGYGGVLLSSCELYDPASGTWSATGSMATARFDHTATLLPCGQVLVAGGSNGAFLTSSENYDPASGTWSGTGSMATARYAHTSTLLPSGQVLVAGGYNGGNLSSCELFDAVGAQAAWKPTITAVAGSSSFPVTLVYGASVAVDGIGFKGISEASGGHGGQNSSSNYPIVRLVGLSSGGFGGQDSTVSRYFGGSATGWAAGTSLTFTLPAAANNPDAFYLLYVITNGIPSGGKIVRLTAPVLNQPPVVTVGPATTVVTNQTYNGAVTINDPSSTSWNVTVSFGDGTSPLVVSGIPSSPLNFTHKYASASGSPFTITATVTDNQGAVGSNTVQVTAVTPLAAVASLKAEVQALVPLKLTSSNAKLLTQVLDLATLRLNQGQPAAAITLLRSFVSYVVRFRATGALLDPDAQQVIDAANAIISGLTP